jgi:hypothetical protein
MQPAAAVVYARRVSVSARQPRPTTVPVGHVWHVAPPPPHPPHREQRTCTRAGLRRLTAHGAGGVGVRRAGSASLGIAELPLPHALLGHAEQLRSALGGEHTAHDEVAVPRPIALDGHRRHGGKRCRRRRLQLGLLRRVAWRPQATKTASRRRRRRHARGRAAAAGTDDAAIVKLAS